MEQVTAGALLLVADRLARSVISNDEAEESGEDEAAASSVGKPGNWRSHARDHCLRSAIGAILHTRPTPATICPYILERSGRLELVFRPSAAIPANYSSGLVMWRANPSGN